MPSTFDLFFKKKNKIQSNIVIYYLVLQFLLDFIEKINYRYDFGWLKFHRILKIFFLSIVFYYVFTNIRKLNKKILFFFISYILIFILAYHFSLQRIEYLLQYIYFFSLILYFDIVDFDRVIFVKIVKKIVYLNFIFIVLGVLFDITLFKTYYGRFGYNGIMLTQMQSTIFYISSIAIALLDKNKLFFFIALLSSFFIGTKALVLAIPILLFLNFKNRISIKMVIVLMTIAIIAFLNILISPTFKEIINNKGILTAIFSYRNEMLLDVIYKIKDDINLLNVLFGQYDLSIMRTEFDFIDVFLFFGISGVILTIFMLKYLYDRYCKHKLNNAFFIVVLLIASFSGNTIVYPFNSFIFLICLNTIFMFRNRDNIIMRNERIKMLNTVVDNLTMEETLEKIVTAIKNNKQIHHVVVNAGKIVSMQSDLRLRESVNKSDMINADGQAVVWASNILNKPLKERVAGIDLMMKLVEKAFVNKYKIYFLGAKETVVKKVVEKYRNEFSNEIIAGYRNGYFDKKDESEIAKEISESKANILFVAISSPMKENFLYENKELLKGVNFIMGVGGSFDVVAEEVKRAPIWMQKNGLEWFYRLIQEPKRMWKRYLLGNLKFILLVFKEKFFGK